MSEGLMFDRCPTTDTERVPCVVNGYLPRQRSVEVRLDGEVPEWIKQYPGARAYLVFVPDPSP